MISGLTIWFLISMSERERLSIEQQADLIDRLVRRCTMMDGRVADEATLLIEKIDVAALADLASRLRRMAPHEDGIRRLVVGR